MGIAGKGGLGWLLLLLSIGRGGRGLSGIAPWVALGEGFLKPEESNASREALLSCGMLGEEVRSGVGVGVDVGMLDSLRLDEWKRGSSVWVNILMMASSRVRPRFFFLFLTCSAPSFSPPEEDVVVVVVVAVVVAVAVVEECEGATAMPESASFEAKRSPMVLFTFDRLIPLTRGVTFDDSLAASSPSLALSPLAPSDSLPDRSWGTQR